MFSGSELVNFPVSLKLPFFLKLILPLVKEPYRSAVEGLEPAFTDSDGSTT